MNTPLYRSRPGGFDIQPASQAEGLSNSHLITTREGRIVVDTGMDWFHARATGELYPSSPASIHLDLVELAEVALDAEAAECSALQVSLSAHERLPKQSENFWESRWLEHPVDRLRDTLGA